MKVLSAGRKKSILLNFLTSIKEILKNTLKYHLETNHSFTVFLPQNSHVKIHPQVNNEVSCNQDYQAKQSHQLRQTISPQV